MKDFLGHESMVWQAWLQLLIFQGTQKWQMCQGPDFRGQNMLSQLRVWKSGRKPLPGKHHGFLGRMSERRAYPINSVLSQVSNKLQDEVWPSSALERYHLAKWYLFWKSHSELKTKLHGISSYLAFVESFMMEIGGGVTPNATEALSLRGHCALGRGGLCWGSIACVS